MRILVFVIVALVIGTSMEGVNSQTAEANCGKRGPQIAVNSASPVGLLIPSSHALIAIFDVHACKIDVTLRNVDENSLRMHVESFVNEGDGNRETFVLWDGNGVILDTTQATMESTDSVVFDFASRSLTIPEGQTKQLFVYADVTEFEDDGDRIQMGILGDKDVRWGRQNWRAHTIPRGGLWAGVLINPS